MTVNLQIAKMENALAAYLQAFEKMQPDNFDHLLEPLLAKSIYFQDPLNKVDGVPATLAIFQHMFDTLENPQFTILHHCLCACNSHLDKHCTALVHWEFRFVLNGKRQQFEGTSQITLDANYKICRHVDFWDAGEHIYSQIPIVGWAIRQIKKRLASPLVNTK